MDINIIELQEKIQQAEYVLIGIGLEFEFEDIECELHDEDSIFKRDLQYIQNKVRNSRDNNNIIKAFQQLKSLVKNSNYFIVDMTKHGLIHQVGFQEERIVCPMGDLEYLQCKNACCVDLYKSNDVLEQESGMESLLENYKNNKYICPKCGERLIFNYYKKINYVETRYMENWNVYQSWLQRTLNKKLLILELGVGLEYPQVIRFPFEKIAFYNQKSYFIRVHHSLPQIVKEIKVRSIGIRQNGIEFLIKNNSR
jgi:NAD-dependent SIR2 family protein deacetylase